MTYLQEVRQLKFAFRITAKSRSFYLINCGDGKISL